MLRFFRNLWSLEGFLLGIVSGCFLFLYLLGRPAHAATPATVDWLAEVAVAVCEQDGKACDGFVVYAAKTECAVEITIPPGYPPPPDGWCPPDPRGSYIFRSSFGGGPAPIPHIPPFRLVYCFGYWIPDFMECVCIEDWCQP